VAEVRIAEPAPTPTARLTGRLAAREEEAFREFHDLYFDRLYQFLLVVVRGQEQDAREALQDALLRVARYARPFETEAAFWDWLKVVARSAARDQGRKHRRYLALLQRFALLSPVPRPVQPFDEEDRLRGWVEESLEQLDPQDRLLIEGKYVAEATVKDLSAQTGLTVKAVESRLLRLRNQLRERLLRKMHSS
jgi:RNA polymerase sigma-70 factor (ECF subfamily)